MLINYKLFLLIINYISVKSFIISPTMLNNYNNLDPEIGSSISNSLLSLSTLGGTSYGISQIKNLNLNSNLTRKIVHILAGPLFVSTWGLYSGPDSLFWSSLVPGLSVFYIINKKEELKYSLSRTDDKKEILKGPLIYTMIIWLFTCFYFQTYTGFVSISQLSFGDGFSDIIGRNFGKDKLLYNSKKSVQGSMGFLIAGFLGTIFILLLNNTIYNYQFEIDLPQILLLSLSLAIIESLPLIYDNISVPIACLFILNYPNIFHIDS